MNARKHEYSPTTWRCVACNTYVGHLIASSLPCVPEPREDARMGDTEIDYGAITRSLAG